MRLLLPPFVISVVVVVRRAVEARRTLARAVETPESLEMMLGVVINAIPSFRPRRLWAGRYYGLLA